MKYLSIIFKLILAVCITNTSYAGAILLHKKNATVWLPQQLIKGELTGFDGSKLTVHYNSTSFKIDVAADKTFAINLTLNTTNNKIWVTGVQNGETITSDTLTLTMGYHPVPVVKPFAVIKNGKATLHYKVINDAGKRQLKFLWAADNRNPATAIITNNNKGVANVQIPQQDGIFYFNLLVTNGTDSAHYQTYITRHNNILHAVDTDVEKVSWMDNAVIYEITPSAFIKKGSYDDITQKLPEIKLLGINTIWLQPVYKTKRGGQGYDVTDYTALRQDLGNELQLANLITTAKQLGMRVMFDFVPNHTSINHPYAEDYVKYGKDSHYYNFYQHTNDGAAYSSNYHIDKQGFVSYFWADLVNLNYNNPEVQQWIIESCKYWVNKFGIDGYRFDAVWGIIARTPSFNKRLRTELKAINPDFLLLAEDKGSDKNVYAQGFDAAYDWTADTTWVSQWSWQTKHDAKKSLTIFNSPDSLKRAELLRRQLFSDAGMDNRILRFLENNDVPRFIANHNLAQTKMAAALMFAVPGIPMIYNGQEAGFKAHPYSGKGVFTAAKTIQQTDSSGLFDYYKKLIALRAAYPALRGGAMKEIKINNTDSILAFHRWVGDEHFIVTINVNAAPANAKLNLHDTHLTAQEGKIFATDLLTNKAIDCEKTDTLNINIPMDGFGIRWLLISK
jgi:glycosidase